MLGILLQVDKSLASQVAYKLGLQVPKNPEQPMNHSIPADADPANHQPIKVESTLLKSEALSMANTIKNSIRTRKIAILAADGVNENSVIEMKDHLEKEGAVVHIIALSWEV